MTKTERVQTAQTAAAQLVRQLRAENDKAEKRGSPKVPEFEYDKLQLQLERKLVRA